MSSKAIAEAWAKGWPAIKAGQAKIQSSKAFVHRKMPGDRLTSQIIPLGLSAVGAALLVPGLYSMVLGINKKEGA